MSGWVRHSSAPARPCGPTAEAGVGSSIYIEKREHPLGIFDELKVEDKISDSLTGTKHYHFWGAASNVVEFTLEQKVNNLKSGKYDYAISIMGGDGGATDIYAYVKINGEVVYKADTVITVYNEWHTAEINNIEYLDSDEMIVGIYVKCAGPNAWGKIDDACLNSTKR